MFTGKSGQSISKLPDLSKRVLPGTMYSQLAIMTLFLWKRFHVSTNNNMNVTIPLHMLKIKLFWTVTSRNYKLGKKIKNCLCWNVYSKSSAHKLESSSLWVLAIQDRCLHLTHAQCQQFLSHVPVSALHLPCLPLSTSVTDFSSYLLLYPLWLVEWLNSFSGFHPYHSI